MSTRPRASGLGGIFFRARDPKALQAWYEVHLGLEPSADGTVLLRWRHADEPEQPGTTVWAPFPADTTYFGRDDQPLMVNYRVDDLDAVLAALWDEDVEVIDQLEESEFGRFGWAVDPEGNRFELWEPPSGH